MVTLVGEIFSSHNKSLFFFNLFRFGNKNRRENTRFFLGKPEEEQHSGFGF